MFAPSALPDRARWVRLWRSVRRRISSPVSLERGGKNAMIVMDDANLELALEGALWGAFGTTGQRCTATSRILLHKSIAAEFTQKLVARAQALSVGNGLNEGVEVGPQVNEQQIETSTRYCQIAI